MERLYQPDFSGIFGKDYSNAFLYDQIDTLIWPIFEDIAKSEQLKKLLSFKTPTNHPYFYHRKVTLEDIRVELQCANIGKAFLQAMDLGKDYGISNRDILNVIEKAPQLFKAILSFDIANNSNNIIDQIQNFDQKIDVVGVAIYPSYTGLDLNAPQNEMLSILLKFMEKSALFLKIDMGNYAVPGYQDGYLSKDILHSFLSKYPNNLIVLSGLDLAGDFRLYYQLLKYFRNAWVELDPRTIGGTTPTYHFEELFNLKGFIQNAWYRIMIGSASPTLEISQMYRGFLEATESLPFRQKYLLRTWGFRNSNRINPKIVSKWDDLQVKPYHTVQSVENQQILETKNEINIPYKVKLRSFSVTQLLFITNLVKDLVEKTLQEYPNYTDGNIFFRSYHTTTSLIINEHEFGNYLDLHYKFAELSQQDSTSYFHTVAALENRADFNRFDHDLATMNGRRQIILPIRDGKLEIGGRENFYVLVTFGPRTFQLYFNINLLKL
ncbi:MAG: hypothetical protein BAJALOKI1v1_270007 [Promethearchaeota archaeon]|nr:MAG: hypothetical protein BAJALOKI1v1_270007 [Candidatus Lokiarchaeota archaeon]